MPPHPTRSPKAANAASNRRLAQALIALACAACADVPSAPTDALASLGLSAGGNRRAASVCVAGDCAEYGTIRVTGIVPQAESEPNNFVATADSLSARSSDDAGPVAAVSAGLASAFDVDVFTVELPAAPAERRYVAEVVAQRLAPVAGPLTTLERVASQGAAGDDIVQQVAETCAQPASADPCLAFTLPAAESRTRLYLRIKARGSWRGRYTVILRRT